MIHAVSRVLGLLAKFAPQAMAVGVFLGLVVPDLASVLRPWLAPAVWGLLYLAMLRVEWEDLIAQLKRPVLAASTVVWMLVFTPAVWFALLQFVDLRPGVEAGIILSAATSPLISTASLGIMFGLDGALLLIILIAGTFLVPLTLPIVALWALGLDLGTDPLILMGRMAGLVLSSAACAILTKRVLSEALLQRRAPEIDGTAVILLIAFAVGIMDGLTARIFDDPLDILGITAASFASYTGLMIVTGVVFALLAPGVHKRGALSVAFISGTRNLAIILAVLPPNVDPDIPLFFAVGQFPIYIMPMLLKPVFVRMLGANKGSST